mmetsp:Transcript_29306/g.58480  ORF Transcript_29306/g.58480 Transcript_29306/m.58480 type:complete len:187 (+) Transcript_29306:128-688(+)
MGAVNLRAEKSEELSQRIVKDAEAASAELGAQLDALKGAALSVRNLVISKASEHSDGWLGLALELSKADSLEGFLGDAAADDIDTIKTATTAASSALDAVTRAASSGSVQARSVEEGCTTLTESQTYAMRFIMENLPILDWFIQFYFYAGPVDDPRTGEPNTCYPDIALQYLLFYNALAIIFGFQD